MSKPSISIIISTYNSAKVINQCLAGIKRQQYPKKLLEVIVVDNNSKDDTVSEAKKYGAKVFFCDKQAPQVCRQRNLGAEKAQFEYLYILDHDMELKSGFLNDFAKTVRVSKSQIDAWYVPETIVSGSVLFSKIRTFENNFYDETPIGAARIIKKQKFYLTNGYDPILSGGPADWDMDIQLRQVGCVFDTMKTGVFHHEEGLSYFSYLAKKGQYVRGAQLYKEKWKKLDKQVYKEICSTQYSFYYRLIGIFLKNGNWKKVIFNIHLYIGYLITKFLVAMIYYLNIFRIKNEK